MKQGDAWDDKKVLRLKYIMGGSYYKDKRSKYRQMQFSFFEQDKKDKKDNKTTSKTSGAQASMLDQLISSFTAFTSSGAQTDDDGAAHPAAGHDVVPRAPSSEGFTIYTRSGCEFCNRAKELLIGKNRFRGGVNIVECDNYLFLNDRQRSNKQTSFWNYMATAMHVPASHKTFPVIFYKNKFIGGYSETLEYFSSPNNKL